MRALRAINNLLAKAAISLAMFIVFLMVAALALSATTRFITGTGFAWFIELPPVMVSWLVFPLLGPLLKQGQHIKVDFLSHYLSEKSKNIIVITEKKDPLPEAEEYANITDKYDKHFSDKSGGD